MPSESIQVTDVQDYFLNVKSLRVQNVTADTERVLCIKKNQGRKVTLWSCCTNHSPHIVVSAQLCRPFKIVCVKECPHILSGPTVLQWVSPQSQQLLCQVLDVPAVFPPLAIRCRHNHKHTLIFNAGTFNQWIRDCAARTTAKWRAANG